MPRRPPARPHDGGSDQHGQPLSLHPEVQSHLVAFHDMAVENMTLKQQVQQLRNELEIVTARLNDLQSDVNRERSLKERFQRYSVKFSTGTETILREAHNLQEAANQFALEQEKSLPPPLPSEIEAEIGEITASLKQEPR
jgi:chromosome segregation ATPase